MPLVKGQSLKEAMAAIKASAVDDLSIESMDIVYGYAKNGDPSQVIMQNPDPGTPIDAKTKPTLVVVESVTVPDVTDMTLGEALIKLSGYKLFPEVDKSDGGISGDELIEKQDPSEGAEVAVFTPIQLTLRQKEQPIDEKIVLEPKKKK